MGVTLIEKDVEHSPVLVSLYLIFEEPKFLLFAQQS